MKIIILLLLTPILLLSQEATVKGKITCDDTTSVMKGAAIILIGCDKNFHAATDENGAYEIKNVPAGKYVIKCEYIGVKTKTEDIKVTESDQIIVKDFYLEETPIKNNLDKMSPGIKLLSKKQDQKQ
jgi:hypothetical protein